MPAALAEWLLLEVPNGLPAERAALTEPIAVGWRAVQHARLTPEDVPLRQRASRQRKVGGNYRMDVFDREAGDFGTQS